MNACKTLINGLAIAVDDVEGGEHDGRCVLAARLVDDQAFERPATKAFLGARLLPNIH